MRRTIRVKSEIYLDRIEADWRRTFGVVEPGHVLNNAVSIVRVPGRLTVVNDGGDTVHYVVDTSAMTGNRFPNPFKKNHCVVLAFTELADKSTYHARRLAKKMYGRSLSRDGITFGLVCRESILREWADAAGVELIGKAIHFWRPPRQRLETFISLHPRGRWLILVTGHAVALVNGTLYNVSNPRSLVRFVHEVKLPGGE